MLNILNESCSIVMCEAYLNTNLVPKLFAKYSFQGQPRLTFFVGPGTAGRQQKSIPRQGRGVGGYI